MYNLKILREQAGFNMREVARQLNIPYTTYVGYEKGDREPNSETLIKIAEFYDTTVDYILGVPRSYKAIHENSCSKTDIFKQIQENYGPSTKEAISIYIQLDTEDKAEIRGEMKQMLKAIKKDHIIIFSTHIMELALDLCDEIVILNHGVLEEVPKEHLNKQEFKDRIIDALRGGEND